MLTKEHVHWAYRLFLDREPENKQVVQQFVQTHRGTEELRQAFLNSPEFRLRNGINTFSHKEIIYETPLGVRLVLNLADRGVSCVVLNDAYEPAETAFVCNHCRPGQVALDIGANIGYYTVLLAKLVGPTGFVHAFEPRPDFCDWIGRSLAENPFAGRWAIHCCALADYEGTAKFRVMPRRGLAADDPNQRSACYLAGHENDRDPEAYWDVQVRILDKILAAYSDQRVGFIKIDVEGAEYLVFQGARELLRRDRPIILSEIFDAQLRTISRVDAATYVRFLCDLGYACHALDDKGNLNPITNPTAYFSAPACRQRPLVNVAFLPA